MTTLLSAERNGIDFQVRTTAQADDLSAQVDNLRATNLHTRVELLQILAQQTYRFITVTPVTHERFLARNAALGKKLEDIFGWNMPFESDTLSPPLRRVMREAGFLQTVSEDQFASSGAENRIEKSVFKSSVRVSSLGDDLLLHSAFPTTSGDAVFFGPDTYRFARFIRQTMYHTAPNFAAAERPLRVLDIGCGSGAGGLTVARSLGARRVDLTLNDINAVALEYAKANMQRAGIDAHFLLGDVFTTPHGEFDLIISNPPYMQDSAGRTYRNGGERLGLDFSLRVVQHGIHHLAPGGQLLLYTGVAMTAHTDPFLEELIPLLAETDCHWACDEIDPDVFGEELEQPAYTAAHRIAAVGLVVTRPG